jgi:hypothetical protein
MAREQRKNSSESGRNKVIEGQAAVGCRPLQLP